MKTMMIACAISALSAGSAASPLRGNGHWAGDLCTSDAGCPGTQRCYKFVGTMAVCHDGCPRGWACDHAGQKRDDTIDAPFDEAPADDDSVPHKPNHGNSDCHRKNVEQPWWLSMFGTVAPAPSDCDDEVPADSDEPQQPNHGNSDTHRQDVNNSWKKATDTAVPMPPTTVPMTTATTGAPSTAPTQTPSTTSPATVAPATVAPNTAPVATEAPKAGNGNGRDKACGKKEFEGCGYCWSSQLLAKACAQIALP